MLQKQKYSGQLHFNQGLIHTHKCTVETVHPNLVSLLITVLPSLHILICRDGRTV